MAAEPLLRVAEIDGRGRGFVSTQPLKAGQVVLKDSPILLYSAFPFQNPPSSSFYSYCQHCVRNLQSSSSSTKCPSCSSLFCSPACVSSAASSSHSPFMCEALFRLANSPNLFLNHPTELQIQSRFLTAAYNLSLVSPIHFQTLLSFQGNPSVNDVSTAGILHSIVPTAFSVELIAALLSKDRLNAFGLMEPNQGSVRAYGFYPKASLFNHDCLPNACRFDYLDKDTSDSSNTDLIVRMIHDVPQGREICLSYFPVNFDYATRQKRLIEDYGFTCECDRCKVECNWSDNEEIMEEEDEEMAGSENDFPHAYFFMRYMCDGDGCWGTLAPLPPLSASDSSVLECNVCGKLKNDVGNDDDLSMDDDQD